MTPTQIVIVRDSKGYINSAPPDNVTPTYMQPVKYTTKNMRNCYFFSSRHQKVTRIFINYT
jgi:hypothetical protein